MRESISNACYSRVYGSGFSVLGRNVWRALAVVFLLGMVFCLSGCPATLKELKTFKELWSSQEYQAIAEKEVRCEPGQEGCNQLHLMKGDACYRVAKQGLDEEKNYKCAAKELEIGMKQTKDWQLEAFDLNRAQTYENLCESLRNLHDLQRGEAARATKERFLSVAEEFVRLEPRHPAAIYFVSKARFQKLQPRLLNVTNENRQRLCNQLILIFDTIDRETTRAMGTRYEENYRQLKNELGTVKTNILRCP